MSKKYSESEIKDINKRNRKNSKAGKAVSFMIEDIFDQVAPKCKAARPKPKTTQDDDTRRCANKAVRLAVCLLGNKVPEDKLQDQAGIFFETMTEAELDKSLETYTETEDLYEKIVPEAAQKSGKVDSENILTEAKPAHKLTKFEIRSAVQKKAKTGLSVKSKESLKSGLISLKDIIDNMVRLLDANPSLTDLDKAARFGINLVETKARSYRKRKFEILRQELVPTGRKVRM